MVAQTEEQEPRERKHTKLEETETELKATILAGEEVGQQLKGDDVSDEEREALRKELKMIADKADALRDQIAELKSEAALERKVFNIGRKVFGDRPAEADEPVYGDPIAKLMGEMKARGLTKAAWQEHQQTLSVEFKTPQDITATTPANAGDFRQTLRPGIVTPAVYPNRVGPLFAQATMDGSQIFWLFTDDIDGGADLVDLGDQKPKGTGNLDIDSVPARKIAATFTVPDDSLDDLPGLESTLRTVLTDGPGGVLQKADSQYINGSGTGTPAEVVGVLSLTPDTVSGSNGLAQGVIEAAMDIEAETNFAATAAVCNPLDYINVLFIESSAGFPIYQGSNFFGPPALGLNIVRSKAVPPGTVVVGAFNTSILYTRMAVNIAMSNQGLGLFDYNLTMFRAETRVALVHPYGKRTYRKVTAFS